MKRFLLVAMLMLVAICAPFSATAVEKTSEFRSDQSFSMWTSEEVAGLTRWTSFHVQVTGYVRWTEGGKTLMIDVRPQTATWTYQVDECQPAGCRNVVLETGEVENLSFDNGYLGGTGGEFTFSFAKEGNPGLDHNFETHTDPDGGQCALYRNNVWWYGEGVLSTKETTLVDETSYAHAFWSWKEGTRPYLCGGIGGGKG